MADSFLSLLNSLERATHLTKCLPAASNQHEISAVYASLKDAHQSIQNFLQQQQQQALAGENNIINNNTYLRDGEEQAMLEDGGDQQMPAIVEDEEVERLQETMEQVCALQNKRRKRAHSPDDPIALHYFNRLRPLGEVLKPEDRQRKFDLIFQFHA